MPPFSAELSSAGLARLHRAARSRMLAFLMLGVLLSGCGGGTPAGQSSATAACGDWRAFVNSGQLESDGGQPQDLSQLQKASQEATAAAAAAPRYTQLEQTLGQAYGYLSGGGNEGTFKQSSVPTEIDSACTAT